MGSTWSLLCASWAQLGALWVPLAPNLDVLDASWVQLGASWAQLGASWVPLGLNLEPLGRLLGLTWGSWTPLGLNLEPLGRQVGLCTAVWAALPGLLGSKLGCVQPIVLTSLGSWPPSWALHGRLCSSPRLLGRRLCSSPWPLERVFAICTPVSTALPGLLSATLCHVHPSVLFAMMYYLTCELPFELTQQLPVRTKLHLNFHNSCRF